MERIPFIGAVDIRTDKVALNQIIRGVVGKEKASGIAGTGIRGCGRRSAESSVEDSPERHSGTIAQDISIDIEAEEIALYQGAWHLVGWVAICLKTDSGLFAGKDVACPGGRSSD